LPNYRFRYGTRQARTGYKKRRGPLARSGAIATGDSIFVAQIIGAVNAVLPAVEFVAGLRAEYDAAAARFAELAAPSGSCWSGSGATALAD
jgi:hypothetical protein